MQINKKKKIFNDNYFDSVCVFCSPDHFSNNSRLLSSILRCNINFSLRDLHFPSINFILFECYNYVEAVLKTLIFNFRLIR